MNKGFFGFSRPGNVYPPGSYAHGVNVRATGKNAIAIGVNCTASNYYGMAIGQGNQSVPFLNSGGTTSGYGPSLGSVLIGAFNFATQSSYGSVAIGILNNQTGGTLASASGSFKGIPVAGTVGRLSTSVGVKNISSGARSTAAGYGNNSSGSGSICFGFGNIANANFATTVGYQNTASGGYSTAAGYVCAATGARSTAVGQSSTASGASSLSIGRGDVSAGDNSTAAGYKNSMNAASLNCHLVGGFNFASSTSFAAVAFGLLNNQTGGTLNTTTGAITGTPAVATTIGRLSTAVGVKNLTSGIQSIAAGYNNTASGQNGVALGYNNTASAYQSTAIGSNNTASNTYNTAIGRNSTASGQYGAMAIGRSCVATGGRSIAVGISATASGSYSVALGYGASTNTFASVVIAGGSGTGILASAANQLLIGTINDAYFGNGVTNASPNNLALQPTGGSGTDIAGGNFVLAGGKPTGSGVAGLLQQKYPKIGATGTTLRALTTTGYVLPSVMMTTTADASVSNTVTETTIIGTVVGTQTVEGGIWRVGRTLRFRVWGTVASTLTPTLRIKVKIGSVVVLDSTAAALSVITGTEGFMVEGGITCRTLGASGTVSGQGIFVYGTSATGGVTESLVNTAVITLDTTADATLDVTATWGTASASNAIVGTNAVMEWIN